MKEATPRLESPRLSELIAPNELKESIKRIITEFFNRDKLLRNGLENKRKILFSGPSGTGKTMSAQIIAGVLNLPIYSKSLFRIFNIDIGETATKIRKEFPLISNRPAVYFFNDFVSCKDSDLKLFFESLEHDSSQCLIIVGINNLGILDKALFKRFDDVIHFNLPSDEEKMQFLKSRIGKNISSKELETLLPRLNDLNHDEINRICLDIVKESIITDSKISISMADRIISKWRMARNID